MNTLYNMKLTISFFMLVPSTIAALNGHCTDIDHLGPGSFLVDGICTYTSTCKQYGGSYATGACPGDPEDVKCCFVNTCAPANGEWYSYCDWTANGCLNGHFVNGELDILSFRVEGT
jgi:hypothetical protein